MRLFPSIVLLALTAGLIFPAQGAPPVLPDNFTNSLGLKFRPVPGTDVAFSLWLTRVQDYRAYASATGQNVTAPDFSQDPTHPVVCVSWEDAKAFCTWLTNREHDSHVLPPKAIYRLPTSREWSLAVGLSAAIAEGMEEPASPVYPWGTQWPPPRNAGNYHPSLGVDSFPYTSPVGSFPANQLGLYDMGGNVWEWCEDVYNNSAEFRILRGASWRLRDPEDLASTKVIGNKPDLRLDVYGFRIVIAGEEAK